MHPNKLLFVILMIATNVAVSTPETGYEANMMRLVKLAKGHSQPFAAMIIDNHSHKILCEGVNNSRRNPTFHGEMVVINNCAAKFPKLDWSQTTLITTAEPCPMCAGAIVWANISKTVYGTSIPYLKSHRWGYINIRAESIFEAASGYKGKIVGGILHEKTDKLFAHGEF